MNKEKKINKLPQPTLSRLCKVYGLLESLDDESTISSKEIGKRIGAGSHNIRKDISYIGEPGTSGAGYDITRLKSLIENKLGFKKEHNACVLGLEGLGIALINNSEKIFGKGFKVVAGFDSSINRIEIAKTNIPVYPTYEISQIVKKHDIELAIITTLSQSAEKITARLYESGVRGIINLSPFILNAPSDKFFVSNIDLVGEFRYLLAQINLTGDYNEDISI
jgi:redox-sensing transcriptional repressor